MNILGKDTSETFDAFFDEAISIVQKEIHFRPVREHPLPAMRDIHGIIESSGDYEYTCYLNDTLGNEDFEIVAAHEIYHTILDAEGYPNTACPREIRIPKYQWEIKTCARVSSAVLDREIDHRMHNKLGYNVWERTERTGREKLKNLKGQKRLPTIRGPRGSELALDYMNTRHYCSNGLAAAIEAQIHMINIELKGLGLRLRGIIEKYGHDTPEGATRSMVKIRDALKTNAWCKVIVPPAGEIL